MHKSVIELKTQTQKQTKFQDSGKRRYWCLLVILGPVGSLALLACYFQESQNIGCVALGCVVFCVGVGILLPRITECWRFLVFAFFVESFVWLRLWFHNS